MNTSYSISRRQLLRVGVGSCMSLSLGRFLELQAAEGTAAPVARAKSVIHIFLPGALGQHESWDPKPEAAAEYRGEFGAIGTKVPGMQLCELLKKTAGVADKLTLLRGVWHTESAHERGQMTMLTGWRPSPAVMYPSMGSIVSHELGSLKNLPPFVTIPSTPAQAGTGYLSPTFGAFSVGGEARARLSRRRWCPRLVDEKARRLHHRPRLFSRWQTPRQRRPRRRHLHQRSHHRQKSTPPRRLHRRRESARQALPYDPATARLVAKWPGHEGGVLSIAYSREGRLLTGGHDATARLWDETGKQITQLKNCDTGAFHVAFTSTQHPLVDDWSGTVREWTAEGKELRSLSARTTD